jgi:hypothetical protein
MLDNFYGEQLIVASFEFINTEMNNLLRKFLVEYKPCNCVVLFAESPGSDEIS